MSSIANLDWNEPAGWVSPIRPVHRASCAGGPSCCSAEPDLQSVSVLYVDHDPTSRRRVTETLADAGMLVDAVPSARSAMRLLRLGLHQAVVIDLDWRSSLAEVELLDWAAHLRPAPALLALTPVPLLHAGLAEASLPRDAALIAKADLADALMDPYVIRHLIGRVVWGGPHASVRVMESLEARQRFLADGGRRARKVESGTSAKALLDRTYRRLERVSDDMATSPVVL